MFANLMHLNVYQCNLPYIGNGDVCGLDSDSDGCPDEDFDCNEDQYMKVRTSMHAQAISGINM